VVSFLDVMVRSGIAVFTMLAKASHRIFFNCASSDLSLTQNAKTKSLFFYTVDCAAETVKDEVALEGEDCVELVRVEAIIDEFIPLYVDPVILLKMVVDFQQDQLS